MSPDGYVARWQGEHYEASPTLADGRLVLRLYRPDPAASFDQVAPGRHVRAVPLADLDELHYVARICHWRGAPFRVLASDRADAGADRLLIEYAGPDPAPQHLDLTRIEPGVHRTWIPATDAELDLRATRLR